MATDVKIVGFQARDWVVTQQEVDKIKKLAGELKTSPKVLRPELTTHIKETIDSLKVLKYLENILKKQTEQMENLKTEIRNQIQNMQHRLDSLESSVKAAKGSR